MKVGLTTYSLSKAMKAGDINILQAIEWIADNGGEHVEISPSGCFVLAGNDSLIEAIVKKAKETNLEISSYTIKANFLHENDAAYKAEIERAIREVDVANKLGAKLMRHDVCNWHIDNPSEQRFQKDLPKVAHACRTIADYAKQFEITTSVENHGLLFQHSHRIHRLIEAVDRDNFRTTLDIANFACVDENCISAVTQNAKLASLVHAKDFFMRSKTGPNPGQGWIRTLDGNWLRGLPPWFTSRNGECKKVLG
ncbi:MAG: sugar phosphate isomerase/epimerase family protein [Candidatus Babeliales bacterium]